MAIDPKMYEKYSGRSGDPYKRLGEALAKSSVHQQKLESAEKGFVGGLNQRWKAKAMVTGIAVLIALVVLLIQGL